MSMNEDRFAGTAKNVGGRVEQGFGRATGDMKTEAEGKAHQVGLARHQMFGAAVQAGRAYLHQHLLGPDARAGDLCQPQDF